MAPTRTVTEVGTVALVLFEPRFTTVPPVGAGPVRVTVPDALLPPVTDVGETPTLRRSGGLIVRMAEAATLL